MPGRRPATASSNGSSPLLTAGGAVLVDGLTTGVELDSRMPSLRLNSYELRPAFDAYLKRRGPASPVTSLADLIASGKYLSRRQHGDALPGNDAGRRARLRQPSIAIDLEGCALIKQGAHRSDGDESASRRCVDSDQAARGDRRSARPTPGFSDNPISAVTGLPAVVVPARPAP